MRHTPFLVAALILAAPATVLAQKPTASTTSTEIANALSSAPSSVADNATVMLMDGTVLRPGTNGWVCMPDMPSVPNNSPMCLDGPWLEFMDALMNRREPKFSGIGIGYMLQGDMPVSNVDPFATGPTVDNQWLPDGIPHVMIAVSDQALLEGISTDPHHGGPWIMWKGTPYAHIMIPMVSSKE